MNSADPALRGIVGSESLERRVDVVLAGSGRGDGLGDCGYRGAEHGEVGAHLDVLLTGDLALVVFDALALEGFYFREYTAWLLVAKLSTRSTIS